MTQGFLLDNDAVLFAELQALHQRAVALESPVRAVAAHAAELVDVSGWQSTAMDEYRKSALAWDAEIHLLRDETLLIIDELAAAPWRLVGVAR
ncbi:hypothetical protein FHX49_002043 [Microbacterium endophyticum]|uniref:WXG100 family type VII secretion target n=1 Tax=Microbacterium endophyticum TaxID=1526412 RepID=A0A7W4V405_9MICO|nr:hypothetical protein [Microbacterium endophyticum]MBB2976468.1 hypothetical protein [Microbacterium endophyticum]NIK35914.1 hypothetical protein [Microbacterium endophyticum]